MARTAPDCVLRVSSALLLMLLGAVRFAWVPASSWRAVPQLAEGRYEVAQRPEASSRRLQLPHSHQQIPSGGGVGREACLPGC